MADSFPHVHLIEDIGHYSDDGESRGLGVLVACFQEVITVLRLSKAFRNTESLLRLANERGRLRSPKGEGRLSEHVSPCWSHGFTFSWLATHNDCPDMWRDAAATVWKRFCVCKIKN